MAVKTLQLQISPAEYQARCEHLLAQVQAAGLNGAVLFEADYIKYYTGFNFIPTERPMALLINALGERVLFVPRLEAEHAEANALIDRVTHYKEFPGKPHAMHRLAEVAQQMQFSGTIGVDNDGYPWIFGYRGPALSTVTGQAVQSIRATIEDQMAIKSAAELALLSESCRWANLALQLLQRYTRPGGTETEAARQAHDEATSAMLDAIGPIYRSQSAYFAGGAEAVYRGQIGRNSAIPHTLANNITFQPGDVLVGEATAPVWGYLCELERTMVLGDPSDEQHRFFDHMIALQTLAFEAIRPGLMCAEVDEAVRAYYEKNDLTDYWKHHTGHNIGLRYHEGPFLDTGDETVIQPGMVFTVEPGLYKSGLGGFRHSDTVVVTEDGIDIMTYYPRDLESLTIPLT